MISDRELWACASHVLERHGRHVDEFIAERTADLAAKGDEAGARTWLAIAERVDQLRNVAGDGRSRH